MRRLIVVVLLVVMGCSSGSPDFETLLDVPDAAPGDLIALRAAGSSVEYIHRRDGTIHRATDSPDGSGPLVELLAKVDVSTEGEQRGLLGHTTIGARRFAAWTTPDTLELVVGELVDGRVARIVWGGTGTSSKAIGGHLETLDGQLLLGIGSLTDWATAHGSGALVLLDPDAPAEQTPTILSDGWNNPFAFTVGPSGEVWVADNAPDGSDLPVEDRDGERITSATSGVELVEPPPQRAPSAVAVLPDGRLAVCGFLDDELRAYAVSDDGSQLERAGTIGACRSGVTVLTDGSIVTSSSSAFGTALLVRPPS